MNRLLVFGLGYTGRAVAEAAAAAGWKVMGTVRVVPPDGGSSSGSIPTIPFADAEASIAAATHVLITAPPLQPPALAATPAPSATTSPSSSSGPPPPASLAPSPSSSGLTRGSPQTPKPGVLGDPRVKPEDDGDGARDAGGGARDAGGGGPEDQGVDPVLALYAAALRAAPNLRWIGYLSSTVVYGNRDGDWVTEATPPAPSQARGHRRLAAEQAWEALSDRYAVDIIRLAGIYGPGRSAFDDLREGRARRMIKPGHCFGRIHRDDIARAVFTAMARGRPPGRRVLNLTDDEPSESAVVMTEAAKLLNLPLPPEVLFEDALPTMSPMARSFWAENRKVACAATKAALGIAWLYPTYREGLRAILRQEGEGA